MKKKILENFAYWFDRIPMTSQSGRRCVAVRCESGRPLTPSVLPGVLGNRHGSSIPGAKTSSGGSRCSRCSRHKAITAPSRPHTPRPGGLAASPGHGFIKAAKPFMGSRHYLPAYYFSVRENPSGRFRFPAAPQKRNTRGAPVAAAAKARTATARPPQQQSLSSFSHAISPARACMRGMAAPSS